jgi:hypothetical protein
MDCRESFSTLLEAFNFCDPHNTGLITDNALFQKGAKRLLACVPKDENDDNELCCAALDPETACSPVDDGIACSPAGGGEPILDLDAIDTDGNNGVNFSEFCEWAETAKVQLPLGLAAGVEIGPGGVPFPPTWNAPKDDLSWDKREVCDDKDVFKEVQELLNKSYKDTWTRDRKVHGMTKVPDGYELVRVIRSQHARNWKRYYLRRHLITRACSSKKFKRIDTLTSKAYALAKRHKVRPEINEWLLFHGTNEDAAEAIASDNFTMKLAGSATGTLYGKGTYFAESITKADEYAKEDGNGLCCVLVVRVIGGLVNYNDEKTPDPDKLQDSVLTGDYTSVLGDREKVSGTFREYVVFDGHQVYVEYILYYRRKM